jgi:hypothetical protein
MLALKSGCISIRVDGSKVEIGVSKPAPRQHHASTKSPGDGLGIAQIRAGAGLHVSAKNLSAEAISIFACRGSSQPRSSDAGGDGSRYGSCYGSAVPRRFSSLSTSSASRCQAGRSSLIPAAECQHEELPFHFWTFRGPAIRSVVCGSELRPLVPNSVGALRNSSAYDGC